MMRRGVVPLSKVGAQTLELRLHTARTTFNFNPRHND